MGNHTKIREELEAQLQKLTRRTGAVERDLRRPKEADWQERATEAENDEVLEQLDEGGRQEIAHIRAALDRMDAGTYGQCTSCRELIPEERLRAVPFSAHCIACAEKA